VQEVLQGAVPSLLWCAVCCDGFLRLKQGQCNKKKMEKKKTTNQKIYFKKGGFSGWKSGVFKKESEPMAQV